MEVIHLEDGKDEVLLPPVQISMLILTLNPELPQLLNTRIFVSKRDLWEFVLVAICRQAMMTTMMMMMMIVREQSKSEQVFMSDHFQLLFTVDSFTFKIFMVTKIRF